MSTTPNSQSQSLQPKNHPSLVFHIATAKGSLGPLSFEEVINKLKAGEIRGLDYFYDHNKRDWELLLEHPDLKQHLPQEWFQPAPKTVQGKNAVNEKWKSEEWFVLKGSERQGPYTYLNLIKMLQEKKLFEYEYCWNPKFQNWQRIADCQEFTPDEMKKLRSVDHPEIEEVFFRRRHARLPHRANMFVHNNKKLWKVDSFSISSGGLGFEIKDDTLFPGDRVYIHYKPSSELPPFNAFCEVVSRSVDRKGVAQIGVQFGKIDKEVQLKIKHLANKAA